MYPNIKEKTRLGTLPALRAAEACKICHSKQLPWLNENPPEVDGQVSWFGLDEWLQLSSRKGVA